MSNTLTHNDDNTEEDRKLAAAEKKNLGNIAFKEQRLDEALTLYDEAIALDPTQMSFYNNKGGIVLTNIVGVFVCSSPFSINLYCKYNLSIMFNSLIKYLTGQEPRVTMP